MNIDEAISTNRAYLEKYGEHMLSKERDAQKLGNAALEREQGRRSCHLKKHPILLPGETDE